MPVLPRAHLQSSWNTKVLVTYGYTTPPLQEIVFQVRVCFTVDISLVGLVLLQVLMHLCCFLLLVVLPMSLLSCSFCLAIVLAMVYLSQGMV